MTLVRNFLADYSSVSWSFQYQSHAHGPPQHHDSWSNHEPLRSMKHVTGKLCHGQIMNISKPWAMSLGKRWPLAISMMTYQHQCMVANVIMTHAVITLSKISTTARTIFNAHNPWISTMIRTIINAHIPLSVPITHVIHDHPVLPLGPSSGR